MYVPVHVYICIHPWGDWGLSLTFYPICSPWLGANAKPCVLLLIMALNRWALAPIAIVYNAQASEGRFNLFFIRLTSLVSIRSFPSKRFTSRRFTSRGFQLYGLSTLGAFSSICLNTHISEWKTWHSQQSNFYFSKALFSSVHLLFEETPFLSIQRINKNSLYESNFYFSQESIIFINRNNSLHEFQLYFRLGCVIFKIHNVHVL